MNEKDIEGFQGYELFRRRELAQLHMSYSHEKERLDVIEHGKIEKLKDVLLIPSDGSPGFLSHDLLRHNKNMLIAAITEFTRAAIRGGLTEEVAFAMSDSYIQNCENCHSLAEIDLLYHKSFRSFTSAVHEKGTRHYSPKIKQALRYITVHLHETLTLEKVGNAVALSPCHLSRLFKAETGLSFVDYIQKERIESAKHMLTHTDFTLAAISEYLHFANQSYFIRIFKKCTSCTPSQYRKTHS